MAITPKKIEGTEKLYYDAATRTIYERMENGDFNPVNIGGADNTHESVGTGESAQARLVVNLLGTARKRVTFPASQGYKRLIILAVAYSAVALPPDAVGVVCINASTTNEADGLLNLAGTGLLQESLTSDLPIYLIPIGEPVRIDRVDVITHVDLISGRGATAASLGLTVIVMASK